VHSQLFFSACFRLSLILMLCAERTTRSVTCVCLSTTWTNLIDGRGPLKEVFRSGSSDAGQTHCDPWSIQSRRGLHGATSATLLRAIRPGMLGAGGRGLSAFLALPMHVIPVIGPSSL
jgi:hypothetical protein